LHPLLKPFTGTGKPVAADFGLTILASLSQRSYFISTPVAERLIVSPPRSYRTVVNISVSPDLTIDQQSTLEDRTDNGLDVSSLGFPIGGKWECILP